MSVPAAEDTVLGVDTNGVEVIDRSTDVGCLVVGDVGCRDWARVINKGAVVGHPVVGNYEGDTDREGVTREAEYVGRSSTTAAASLSPLIPLQFPLVYPARRTCPSPFVAATENLSESMVPSCTTQKSIWIPTTCATIERLPFKSFHAISLGRTNAAWVRNNPISSPFIAHGKDYVGLAPCFDNTALFSTN